MAEKPAQDIAQAWVRENLCLPQPALTNLVDNAIKYSSEKREIDIELIETKEEV